MELFEDLSPKQALPVLTLLFGLGAVFGNLALLQLRELLGVSVIALRFDGQVVKLRMRIRQLAPFGPQVLQCRGRIAVAFVKQVFETIGGDVLDREPAEHIRP